MHHLTDIKSAILEIKRVLKTDGVYLGFELNGYNFYIYWLHKFSGKKSPNERPLFPKRVIQLFTEAGFECKHQFFFPRFPRIRFKYMASCFSIEAVLK